MKWTDTLDIAIELADNSPEVDPLTISFPQLMEMVMALKNFNDDPEHCGERILEAIQMAWIEERE
ncbi:MAG: Fe-S cluster assembly protein IscX [Arenicellales bacterium]